MKNCSTGSIPTPYLRVFNHLVGFDGAATSHDKILCGSRAFAALKPAAQRAETAGRVLRARERSCVQPCWRQSEFKAQGRQCRVLRTYESM
jgi:hypothetical protein